MFLTACKDRKMKVQTSFKTANVIEKMGMKDWEELLKTLQSFSKKMESNAIKKGTGKIVRGFVLSEKSVKDLVAEAKREESGYADAEYEIYGSPYRETPNSQDLYAEFNSVSVT